MKKWITVLLALALLLGLAACGQARIDSTSEAQSVNESGESSAAETISTAAELKVSFGMSSPYILHLEENETAQAVAALVGQRDWQLPIYHFDDFENWEVMQYYDIPSRYDIPAEPVSVTEEKGGEVYYSDPNRIIVFYRDAKVSGEYVKIGSFDYSDQFTKDVDENPVLEGWGNKIVRVSPAQ